MGLLLDTSIAIHLRDGDPYAIARLMSDDDMSMSLVSVIELEGGVHANPAHRDVRRRGLDALVHRITVLAIGAEVVETYGHILAATGFSRRTTLDRLIAATAIVHDLPLATANPADFADIPGLAVEPWPVAQ